MRIVRRILFAILIFILLLISVGFFLPKHVVVERSMLMSAPQHVIFDQVNSFRNWIHWSPWYQMDTGMKISYSGPESGTGSSFVFGSTKTTVGCGKFLITNSIAYDSIVMEMDFMDNGKATAKFTFNGTDSGTCIRWTMESYLGNNPISRWFGLFIDKMVGKDFEKGLSNLNEIASVMAARLTIRVKEMELPSQIILSLRDTCSPSTISSKLGLFYEKISESIKKQKLTINGYPFAMYHSSLPGYFDLEAGIPINIFVESTGGMICRVIPAQRTVMASSYGSYEKTAMAYKQIEKYIHDKKMIVAGSPWEVYVTDNQVETDSSKWQTDIYYPVK